MFKDKTILYIVHNYNSFQKDPIEEIAKNFKKVYVLVRYKPISKIVRLLPFKSLKKYDDKYVIDLSNKPKNVEVIKTPVWYLPFGIFYKWLGELHFRAVDRVIKRNNIKFDLVHCHFLWSSGYVGMRLKQKYKKPFIVTGHGFDVYQLPFKSVDWTRRIQAMLRSCNVILTVSKKNKECLTKLEIEDQKIKILHNGFNSEIFFKMDKNKVRDELEIDKKSKVLLTIGNLEKVKGQEFLIKSLKRVSEELPSIKCYVIGGGSLELELKELVKSLNLEKNVIFLGQLKHNQIGKWLNACDVFVMSSLNEGLPISMLEALGLGKPFVGTNVGGIPEVINSEEYGILIEPGNENELYSAIASALRAEWDYEAISKYAKHFTVKSLTQKTLKIYSTLLHE